MNLKNITYSIFKKYWIDHNGEIYDAGSNHQTFIINNFDDLFTKEDVEKNVRIVNRFYEIPFLKGWIRITSGSSERMNIEYYNDNVTNNALKMMVKCVLSRFEKFKNMHVVIDIYTNFNIAYCNLNLEKFIIKYEKYL